jgi:dolichyl-phosphate beta-glucosyltransferase
MDPVHNFSEKRLIDLNNPHNLKLVDQYEDNPDLVPKVDVSIIFPAFNEEARMIATLDSTIKFIDDWCDYRLWNYEIIIIDDGSNDTTADITFDYFKNYRDTIRYVGLKSNQGKGAAVTVGMRRAYGRYMLMVDIDGATDIRDFDTLMLHMEHLEAQAKNGMYKGPAGIVLGSRAHLAAESISKRAFYRTILMKGFHLLVMMFATRQVQDTQCGFKLFTQDAARIIFSDNHMRGWSFDIELIYIAEALGIPMKEVSVNWHEVEGSKLIRTKLDIITTSLYMARDIIAIRLAYMFGFWTLPSPALSSSREEL